jgi:hypothetical protein
MNEILRMIGSAFLGAIVALYLPFFRRLIWGPKLELFFGKTYEGCIAKTPIEIETEVDNEKGKIATVGYYIRVMVRNKKYLLARDCRAFLVNIEKKGADNIFHPTIYCDSIQAQWACRSGQGFQSIDLPRGVNQFVDIISTVKDVNHIVPKIEMIPFRYQELFREYGVFRYTIQVSGSEIKPLFIKIIFRWKGELDYFGVEIDHDKKSWLRKFWPF